MPAGWRPSSAADAAPSPRERGEGPTKLMTEDPSTSLRTPWTTSARDEPAAREQRIAAEQLRLLGSAVHVTGQGIAIMTPAVEAVGPRIAFVNDGFCAMYGRSRAE